MEETIRLIGAGLLLAGFVAALSAILLFGLFIRHMQQIDVPPGAGFSETLLYTPFLVVMFIDLLDLAFDILAAPVSWIVLDRLGLKGLRNVAAVEAVIPFTQVIPLMTLSWIGVRLFGAEKFGDDGFGDEKMESSHIKIVEVQ